MGGLCTANLIESLNSSIETYTCNVKRWQGGAMVQRWVAPPCSMRRSGCVGCAVIATCACSSPLSMSAHSPGGCRNCESHLESMAMESATSRSSTADGTIPRREGSILVPLDDEAATVSSLLRILTNREHGQRMSESKGGGRGEIRQVDLGTAASRVLWRGIRGAERVI